jgi:hypothetical protein
MSFDKTTMYRRSEADWVMFFQATVNEVAIGDRSKPPAVIVTDGATAWRWNWKAHAFAKR